MTRNELMKKKKEKLLHMAQKELRLDVKMENTKSEIVTAILKAETKAPAAKKRAKKAAMKTAVKRKPKVAVKKEKAPAPVVVTKAPEEPFSKAIPSIPSPPPFTTEEAVSEAKYHVAEEQEHLDVENFIPEKYQDNRIALLVRDPFFIFTFWDLHPDTPAHTAELHVMKLDKSTIVLRVYDVTDIEFDGQNAHKWFDLVPGSIFGNWYIEVPEDGSSYLVEIGLKDEFGNFFAMARSNAVITPRATVSGRMDEEWMVADKEFWEMYALSGGFKPGLSSLKLASEMRELLIKSISSGGVSYESKMCLSKEEAGKKEFPFRLDCDLVVYGATRPDSEVTGQGREVNLREDGTFTMRPSLPDGLHVISAEAVSADKQERITITPTVSRSTATFFESRNSIKRKNDGT